MAVAKQCSILLYVRVLLLQGQVLLLCRAELRRLGQAGLLLRGYQLGQVVLLALQRIHLGRRKRERVAQQRVGLGCSGALYALT